jgi:uncharacterized protein (TIGR02001 family)
MHLFGAHLVFIPVQVNASALAGDDEGAFGLQNLARSMLSVPRTKFPFQLSMEPSMKSAAKKSMLVMVLALAGSAFAQTAAPAPDYTLSYNVGATTDYRYRGISQTGKKPALNGGIDYAHKSGFYLGTWASTISWLKDTTANPNTTKGPVEIDVYGGYKGALSDSVGYDVGGLYYWYAGNNMKKTAGQVSPNTFELYGALTFGIVTAKYSHATTNLFGTANSKNSGYLDLSANFDLGSGWSIVPHVGAQKNQEWQFLHGLLGGRQQGHRRAGRELGSGGHQRPGRTLHPAWFGHP